MSTSKLIGKTIVVLLILTLFLLCVFSFIAPKTLSEYSYQLGLDKLSLSYEVLAYNQSKDINELGSVVSKAIIIGDEKRTSKYGNILINHQYYNEYTDFINSSSTFQIDYIDYLESYIISALYNEKQYVEVESILSKAVSERYEEIGIATFLIASVKRDNNIDMATKILEVYDSGYLASQKSKQEIITKEAMEISKYFKIETEIWTSRQNDINGGNNE